MSYMSYSCITRKQCNVIYRAFKLGQLVPPKDCRGKVKSPGFIYRYECRSYYEGFRLHDDEKLLNAQLNAISEIVGLIISGKFEEAQKLFNCEDELFNSKYIPEGVSPKKFWKAV